MHLYRPATYEFLQPSISWLHNNQYSFSFNLFWYSRKNLSLSRSPWLKKCEFLVIYMVQGQKYEAIHEFLHVQYKKLAAKYWKPFAILQIKNTIFWQK